MLELDKTPATNPWKGCCWMEEDAIGKMMDVVNSVSSQTMEVSTLEYVSVLLRLLLKRRGYA